MTIQELKEKVSGFIKNIPTDKKKHLIAGFIICAVVSLFFGYIIGFVAALIAGAGKEAYDHFTKKGTVEFADLGYTVAGSVCFLILSALITLLFYAFVSCII